jgi:hypothetical protein
MSEPEMNKDYQEDSPRDLQDSCPAEETAASWVYEWSEEGHSRRQWESTNREMLISMAKELEREHFLAPDAIARVLHIREDYVQMILKRVGKGGRHE